MASVADLDPGSGAFSTLDPDPGSGIGFSPDPGSQTPYFLELSDKFLGNSLKTDPNIFLQHLKNKIIFNFVKFVATKKGLTTYFFSPLFCCCFWIRDPGWVIIRIRIKHPESATLSMAQLCLCRVCANTSMRYFYSSLFGSMVCSKRF